MVRARRAGLARRAAARGVRVTAARVAGPTGHGDPAPAPAAAAESTVRLEETVNYFDDDVPPPADDDEQEVEAPEAGTLISGNSMDVE